MSGRAFIGVEFGVLIFQLIDTGTDRDTVFKIRYDAQTAALAFIG
jgi:hypothetical protein